MEVDTPSNKEIKSNIKLASISSNLEQIGDNDFKTCFSMSERPKVFSLKVGALGQMFEKSATKLKLYSKLKLLRCKNTIHIATISVRTMNTVNQLPELTAFAVEHNVDIICMQKHWYCHSEQEIKFYDTGWMFVSVSAWKTASMP